MKVTVNEKAKTVTIELPLEDATPSTSGKTMVVASTRGNMTSNATVDGKQLVVGCNVYYKR